MFSIDITLKYTPLPISIERKEAEGAQAAYQQVVEAMRSEQPRLVELTCEKQPDKKVAVISDQISAVIVSQRSGAAATGRAPGFFAVARQE